MSCIYRMIAVSKVATNIIANISASPIGRAVKLVKMSIKTFKTDAIVFIGDAIMCLTAS